MSTRSLETRSAAPLRASGFRWPREWTPYLFIAPLVVYLPAVFAYPLFYNALISFQNFTIRSVVTGAADFVGLDNFRAILSNPVTWLALRNTAIFAASSLFLQYVIGLALALLFTRAFPLKGFMRGIMLLPWLLPSVATVTVWLWLFDGTNGLINYFLLQLHVIAMPVSWLNSPASALVAIIIVNVWVGIPFNLVILYSGIQAIPKELYEAAEIDGARAFQRFRFVTLPLLKPVNAVLLLLGLIYTLKQFDIIYILTKGGPGNATQVLSTWSYGLSFRDMRFGQGAAVGNIMLLISLTAAIWYAFFTRREPGP
ncbi:MAG: sugar ABC transporter permease [Bosea sp.]|nr:sugar ABC transporter permease [Bosea sp. (in: a-proteobacteria)]